MRLIKKIKMGINYLLLNDVVRHCSILNLISPKIRPAIVRFCGAKIGKGVHFSNGIYIDPNAQFLTVEDDVILGPNVILLFHKRDISDYSRGDRYGDKKHIKASVKICRGAAVGIGSTIMPGVIIGEGAMIGAGSLVTKDVPPWTIVAGVPAKIIKVLKEKE